MKFVPSFDFGAAVQGYRQARADYRTEELFPIQRDAAQAQLDSARLDLDLKAQTNANRIAEQNSKLIFGTQDARIKTGIAAALEPGQLANARTAARGQMINEQQLTDDVLRDFMGNQLSTRLASSEIDAQNASAALLRNPLTNQVRGQQLDVQSANLAGELERMPATQTLRNNRLAYDSERIEAALANAPQEMRNYGANLDLAYRNILASGADLETKGEADKMMRETQGLSRQYADIQTAMNDPEAIQNYIRMAASQGRTLTPQQAMQEMDQRADNLGRAIMAMQGRMQDLVRNNNVSMTDYQKQLGIAGRNGVPGTGGPGSTLENLATGAPSAAPSGGSDLTKILDAPIKPEEKPAPELTPQQKLSEQRKAVDKRIEQLNGLQWSPYLKGERLSPEQIKQVSAKFVEMKAESARLKAEEDLIKEAEKKRERDAAFRNLLGN